MKTRCKIGTKNKKSHLWADKGIKVCPEWENFETFRSWAYKNGFRDEIVNIYNKMDCLSLDRIDSSKDYCPENCRWLSLKENSNNVLKNRQDKYEYLLKQQIILLYMVGNDYY